MSSETKNNHMSKEAVDDFLAGAHHAVVSTIRKDGSPQVSAVWYLLENDVFYFVTMAKSAKCRNLDRDPRIGICIDGGPRDYRSVMIYGSAEICYDYDDFYRDTRFRIFRRYYDSDDETRAYIEEVGSSGGGVLITVRPDRVIGIDMSD